MLPEADVVDDAFEFEGNWQVNALRSALLLLLDVVMLLDCFTV